MSLKRYIETPLGPLLAEAGEDGVRRLEWVSEIHACDVDQESGATAHLNQIDSEITEYFAGERRDFTVQVDLGEANGFRRSALEAAQTIEFGETVTYSLLAQRAGSARGARAAGNAMRSNPIALIVPCHRIVRTDGSLGGYGGPGLKGIARKRALIEHERHHQLSP